MSDEKEMVYLILTFLVAFCWSGAAHPTEASGQVVHVVEGDTFDVMIEQSDRDLGDDKIRIRLVDVDSPETWGCGEAARKILYGRADTGGGKGSG